MTITTTLNKIRAHRPCADGWEKLLRHLGKTQADDEPLDLKTIVDSNGINDALWCLRACDGIDREARLYAVWCVRQVQHLLTDPRSLTALDVAEKHANGEVTDRELRAAYDAAKDAARDAASAAAWDAARDVAYDAAKDAARDAASAAAWDAARDVASGASWAAARNAARDAAWAAARAAASAAASAAAKDAAWDAQAAEFRRVFG